MNDNVERYVAGLKSKAKDRVSCREKSQGAHVLCRPTTNSQLTRRIKEVQAFSENHHARATLDILTTTEGRRMNESVIVPTTNSTIEIDLGGLKTVVAGLLLQRSPSAKEVRVARGTVTGRMSPRVTSWTKTEVAQANNEAATQRRNSRNEDASWTISAEEMVRQRQR